MNTNEMSKRLFNMTLPIIFVAFTMFVFFGCGGSNDEERDESIPNPEPVILSEGMFIDSPVDGLEYGTQTCSGITNRGGIFNHQEGETVTFHIGGIIVGTAKAFAVITPLNLVEGAMDETDLTVTNICRFVQTLDADANPENGITISESVRKEAAGKTVDFHLEEKEFETVTRELVLLLTSHFEKGPRVLVSAVEARTHLKKYLETLDNDGDGYSRSDGDCNDNDMNIHPGGIEICGDLADQDCDGRDQICQDLPADTDDDADGYSESQGDCNDTDPDVHPGAEEICGDGRDQNCDGADMVCASDPFNRDDDADGYTEIQGDCDDSDPDIHPAAFETCGDTVDQDCDGNDMVCSPAPEETDDDLDGYSENQGDCDDSDPDIHPEAFEICGDTIDQDCDGSDATCLPSPEETDDDLDGFSEIQGDCNDDDPNVYPGAHDICQDGIDQDCDGWDAACNTGEDHEDIESLFLLKYFFFRS